MARKTIDKKFKLPAFSILEVVIAMIIMVLIFGIATTIFSRVLSFSLSARKLRAQAILQDILRKEMPIGDDSITSHEEFNIKRQIKPFHDTPGLEVMQLTAYDGQEEIATASQIIINEEKKP